MMNKEMTKFRDEMSKRGLEIPMIDQCVRNAEMLVRLEIDGGQELMVNPKFFGMLVTAKLFEAWKKVTARVPQIRPNHRWNCIESELNGDIMAIQWKDVPGTGF